VAFTAVQVAELAVIAGPFEDEVSIWISGTVAGTESSPDSRLAIDITGPVAGRAERHTIGIALTGSVSGE